MTKPKLFAVAISKKWQDINFDVQDQHYTVFDHDRHYRVLADVKAAVNYHLGSDGSRHPPKIEWHQIEAALSTQSLANAYHQPQPLYSIVQHRLGHPNPVFPSTRHYGYISELGDWNYVVIDRNTNPWTVEHVADASAIVDLHTAWGQDLQQWASVMSRVNPSAVHPLPPLEKPAIAEDSIPTSGELEAYWEAIQALRSVYNENKQLMW